MPKNRGFRHMQEQQLTPEQLTAHRAERWQQQKTIVAAWLLLGFVASVLIYFQPFFAWLWSSSAPTKGEL